MNEKDFWSVTIAIVKALRKAIRDKRILIFFDLEGTQFSHEMIEIGAYSVLLHDDMSVKNINPPFKCYVKSQEQVGKIVTELTGITDKKLHDEGLLFPKAFSEFERYVKKYEDRCTFVAFGNQDIKIIQNSVYLNGNAGIAFSRIIKKNYLDFSSFISSYIKDEHGNPYSLTNYLKIFGVPFSGQAHDASNDAYNLIELYKAFLAKKEIVREEYEKTLSRLSHLPRPIQLVMNKLKNGESVSPVFFDEAVEESLR